MKIYQTGISDVQEEDSGQQNLLKIKKQFTIQLMKY